MWQDGQDEALEPTTHRMPLVVRVSSSAATQRQTATMCSPGGASPGTKNARPALPSVSASCTA